MADDFFGPASDLAVTTRPAYSPETPRAGHAPSWFKRCTSEGSDDGTAIDAEWLNHLVANLDAVRTAAGVTSSDLAPSSSSVLVTSILRLIANYAGGGGVGESGSGLTEEQVRDLVAGFVRVSGGMLTKAHDDPGNTLTIGLDPALFEGFVSAGVITSVRFFASSAVWTPANGSNWALLLGVAGGGAGGGVPIASNDVASPGGGGGEARLLFLSALSPSYAVVIGAGGAARANAAGGDGGNTQVKQGSTVKLLCSGGKGGTAWAANAAGAAGTGGSGGWSLGASAGARASSVVGGAGGGSFFGPGAPNTPAKSNGLAATTWGGGGSGAAHNNSGQISGLGGAGKSGCLIIIEGR